MQWVEINRFDCSVKLQISTFSDIFEKMNKAFKRAG